MPVRVPLVSKRDIWGKKWGFSRVVCYSKDIMHFLIFIYKSIMPHIVCSKIKNKQGKSIGIQVAILMEEEKTLQFCTLVTVYFKNLSVILWNKLICDKSQEFNLGFLEGNIIFWLIFLTKFLFIILLSLVLLLGCKDNGIGREGFSNHTSIKNSPGL